LTHGYTTAKMDIAHSIHSEISMLLDNLGLPTKGGLYDPKLGPMTSRDV